MEKFPSQESLPIERSAVSNLLKERGFENPEAKDLLNKWLDENQKKVEESSITNLEFNIAWAELYRDAGVKEAALEAFDQVAELARQEGNDEALRRIKEEITKLISAP